MLSYINFFILVTISHNGFVCSALSSNLDVNTTKNESEAQQYVQNYFKFQNDVLTISFEEFLSELFEKKDSADHHIGHDDQHETHDGETHEDENHDDEGDQHEAHDGETHDGETHDDENHDEDHIKHNGKEKRAIDDDDSETHAEDDHEDENEGNHFDSSISNVCYDAHDYSEVYGIDMNSPLHFTDFKKIAPFLLFQVRSGSCSNIKDNEESKSRKPSDYKKFVYSFVSVAILSLLALGGLLIFPFVTPRGYRITMSLFFGLAASSLFVDAMLHLIPQAFLLHNHSEHEGEDDHDDHSSSKTIPNHFIMGNVIVLGFYIFYIVEAIMSFKKLESKGNSQESNNNLPTHNVHGHSSSSAGCSLRCMVLAGDGIHKFLDGIAIGASFSSSMTEGLATSIAVLCHEIPHELADFAMLLHSGISTKKAALYNLGCSFISFLGLILALFVSFNDAAINVMLSLTAGMFFYIAIAHMAKELIKILSDSSSASTWTEVFLFQNIGFYIGWSLLALIAIYEDDLHFI